MQAISVAHQLCAPPSMSFEEKIRLITIDILTNVQSLESVYKSLQQQQKVVPVQRVHQTGFLQPL